jgi:hypothetical protein
MGAEGEKRGRKAGGRGGGVEGNGSERPEGKGAKEIVVRKD